MDMLSLAFIDSDPILGRRFYAGMYEHCSMRPLWIGNDGMVTIFKPKGANFANMAWGNHATHAKETRRKNRLATKRKRETYKRLKNISHLR